MYLHCLLSSPYPGVKTRPTVWSPKGVATQKKVPHQAHEIEIETEIDGNWWLVLSVLGLHEVNCATCRMQPMIMGHGAATTQLAHCESIPSLMSVHNANHSLPNTITQVSQVKYR